MHLPNILKPYSMSQINCDVNQILVVRSDPKTMNELFQEQQIHFGDGGANDVFTPSPQKNNKAEVLGRNPKRVHVPNFAMLGRKRKASSALPPPSLQKQKKIDDIVKEETKDQDKGRRRGYSGHFKSKKMAVYENFTREDLVLVIKADNPNFTRGKSQEISHRPGSRNYLRSKEKKIKETIFKKTKL